MHMLRYLWIVETVGVLRQFGCVVQPQKWLIIL